MGTHESSRGFPCSSAAWVLRRPGSRARSSRSRATASSSIRSRLRATTRRFGTPRLKSSCRCEGGVGWPSQNARQEPRLSVLGGPPDTPLRLRSVLSPRQELILKLVVDVYLASGKPVPSKELVELPEVEWGASTVRAELAALEAAGYLTHPHTSAGRVPTELGYRRHVDLMMAAGGPPVESA